MWYKRDKVGNELLKDFASNWSRNNAAVMKFGEISPNNLYRNFLLRKTKQEYKN